VIRENDIIENYALKNLHYYVDNAEAYIHKDKPDLQNFRDNIGIEVCQNTTKNEQECRKIWNDICQLEYEEAIKYPKINTPRFKGEIWNIGNGIKALSDSKGLVDFVTHVEVASKIILNKIHKLPTYNFKTMGLFVWLNRAFNTSDVKKLFDFINSDMQEKDKHFDFYILDCSDYGFVCSFINGELNIQKILKS
jgi:hypothetical protein